MDRRKDRPSFIGPFWACLGVQQEKSQKKSQIKHRLNNFKQCKNYLVRNSQGVQGGQDVAYARNLLSQVLASF